jgi:hypothetical protein
MIQKIQTTRTTRTTRTNRDDVTQTPEHEQDHFGHTDRGSLAAHTLRRVQTEPPSAKEDGNLGGRISASEGMMKRRLLWHPPLRLPM